MKIFNRQDTVGSLRSGTVFSIEYDGWDDDDSIYIMSSRDKEGSGDKRYAIDLESGFMITPLKSTRVKVVIAFLHISSEDNS